MNSAIDVLREHYRHRDRAARDWKTAGGKVVGYLCDNVPEELIMAAGFLPYRLSGDPSLGTEALERYVQPFAAPFSARNRGVGFVDAMLEAGELAARNRSPRRACHPLRRWRTAIIARRPAPSSSRWRAS